MIFPNNIPKIIAQYHEPHPTETISMAAPKSNPCPCCLLFTFTGPADSPNGRKLMAATQSLLAGHRLVKHPSPCLAEVMWQVAPQPDIVGGAVHHIPCPSQRALCKLCYEKSVLHVTSCGSPKGGSISTMRRHFRTVHDVDVLTRQQLKQAIQARAEALNTRNSTATLSPTRLIQEMPVPGTPIGTRSLMAASGSPRAGGSPVRYLPLSPQHDALNEALAVFIASTSESARELLAVRTCAVFSRFVFDIEPLCRILLSCTLWR
jgi:hypothetical protein